MKLSPILAGLEQYPFSRLDDWRADARRRGIDVIDFGVGDPRELTPAFIRDALVAGIGERSSYPRAAGLPELREAIAGWIERRFGVAVDGERDRADARLEGGDLLVRAGRGRRAPGGGGARARVPGLRARRPVRGRACRHGAAGRVVRAGCPTWTRSTRWDELAAFWVCYPNNPTGATAPLSFYEELAGRAREHGFLVCSDEAYSELWFGEPPVSALQVADRSHVVVFNTLSKRSSMTGYRSGFVSAAPAVADALRAFRPSIGTAPQEFVQRASVAAWSDEKHVEAMRATYRRKRETLLPVLAAKGLRVAGGDATFFVWLAVDGPSEPFARKLLDHGILVAPGAFFGPAGEGYVRLALVPTQADCERAAAILEAVL